MDAVRVDKSNWPGRKERLKLYGIHILNSARQELLPHSPVGTVSRSSKTTHQVTNSTESLAGSSSQRATQRTALEAAGHLDYEGSGAHGQRSDAALRWFKSRCAGLWGLPGRSLGKEPACNAGDAGDGSVLGWGSAPGGGHGNPLQYLAWRIPGTKEPGRLQSIGLPRARHDWAHMPMQAFKSRACSFLYSWTGWGSRRRTTVSSLPCILCPLMVKLLKKQAGIMSRTYILCDKSKQEVSSLTGGPLLCCLKKDQL